MNYTMTNTTGLDQYMLGSYSSISSSDSASDCYAPDTVASNSPRL